MLKKLLTPALLLTSLLSLGACHREAAHGSARPAAVDTAAHADAGAPRPQTCHDHFMAGEPPRITNPRLGKETEALCFNVFSVLHSGVTRTPLWSAEHLQAQNIEAAQELSRENSFHPEPRLPSDQRAELSDYARSGYDRGHMAPNGDMPDRDSQRDSFSLANIVPQDGENNRNLWAGIEGAVRRMAKKEGDLYVVTGPAFLGTDLRKIGNVLVPTHLYKLVYSPRQRAGAAWFVENTADAKANVIPIPELERIIGINLLPALSDAEKERVLDLPEIHDKAPRGRRNRH
ncbi:DNA/RNA non-specific endonuclease [Massilia pinisoli]|uniref:Endonuclease n=1 Tax=Massilia pinisoli TaxID=1772194 RepID=A0ABT1ZKD0_9BURK|nr:DNA/RNA non-specific endonuclease [Massilia pinisoli]MCS0580219.1 DNA/RNA non-specific endonuclease [Massilia pinisoli]